MDRNMVESLLNSLKEDANYSAQDITDLSHLRNQINSILKFRSLPMQWPHVRKLIRSETKLLRSETTYDCTLCNSKEFLTEQAVAQHVRSDGHQVRIEDLENKQMKDNSINIKFRYDKVIKKIQDEVGDLSTKWEFSYDQKTVVCKLCNVTSMSPFNLKQHAFGAAHASKLQIQRKITQLRGRLPSYEEEVNLMWDILNNLEGTQERIYSKEDMDNCQVGDSDCGDFYCTICDVYFNGPIVVVNHIQGQKHRGNIQVENQVDTDESDGYDYAYDY